MLGAIAEAGIALAVVGLPLLAFWWARRGSDHGRFPAKVRRPLACLVTIAAPFALAWFDSLLLGSGPFGGVRGATGGVLIWIFVAAPFLLAAGGYKLEEYGRQDGINGATVAAAVALLFAAIVVARECIRLGMRGLH